MTPEKGKKPLREEFEVEYPKKGRGRRSQRKLLRRRVHDVSDDLTAASHAEEPSWERYDPPPPEDRAG